MNEQNPYSAPQADASVELKPINFEEIDTKTIKKLRNNSHTIRALGALNLLGVVIILILLFAGGYLHGNSAIMVFTLLSLVIGIVSIYALWWRPAWGYVLGIINCTILLLGFPVGSLIGLLGLIAVCQSRRLFGHDKLGHKDLDKEWKYRKRNKIK